MTPLPGAVYEVWDLPCISHLCMWARVSTVPLCSHMYEGHSVNSEIRCVIAIAYLLAESWCYL